MGSASKLRTRTRFGRPQARHSAKGPQNSLPGATSSRAASSGTPPSGTLSSGGRDEDTESRRWKFPWLSSVAAILIWGGLLIFLYPTVASWFAQYNQSKVLSNYTEAIDEAEPGRIEQLANAQAYNEALSSGAVLEAGANVPYGAGIEPATLPEGVLPYAEQLRAGHKGLMARVKIPKIDLDLPIYHGTSEQTLLEGIGHLEGTSLPVGGLGTRSVITGHRGLSSATMFTNLDKVNVGDIFSIEVFGEVLTYRVYEKRVVDPDETEAIQPEVGRDLMTLVTCTPLGVNTHRILVNGERILPTPPADLAAVGAEPTIPHFPWWAVIVAVATLLAGLYVWRAGYPRAVTETRTSLGPASTKSGGPASGG